MHPLFRIITNRRFRTFEIFFLNFWIFGIFNVSLHRTNTEQMNKKKYVGMKFVTKEGYEIEIIEYLSNSQIIAKFVIHEHVVYVGMYQLKTGSIKNPYHRSVCGVGYLGVGKYKANASYVYEFYRSAWCGMIRRCYDEFELLKHQSYIGSSISEDFKCFQNFCEWAESSGLRKGYNIDKDIKVNGNKCYSSDTCIAIPSAINRCAEKLSRNELPIGISITTGGRYLAKGTIYGKCKYMGTYDTIEEANSAYCDERDIVFKELVDEYRNELLPKTLVVLDNFSFHNNK